MMNKERIKKRGLLLAVGSTLTAVAVACGGKGTIEETTPTQAPDTSKPTRTIEPAIESTPSPTLVITPTEESSEPIQEKGVFSYKESSEFREYENLEIGIIEWSERPTETEGWNVVRVKAFVRNSSDKIIILKAFDRYRNLFRFEKDEFEFAAFGDVAERADEIQWGTIGSSRGGELVFPGFSLPVVISSRIPQIHKDYFLVSGDPEKRIKKGEIAQNFSPIDLTKAEILDQTESWVKSNSVVTFKGISRNVDESEMIPYYTASFDIENKLGDRDVGLGFGIIIYLADGQIIYPAGIFFPEPIAPGFRKTQERLIITDTPASREIYRVDDIGKLFTGAVIGVYSRIEHLNEHAMWQLP